MTNELVELKPKRKYSQAFNKLLEIACNRNVCVCSIRFAAPGLRGLYMVIDDRDMVFIDTYKTKGKKLLKVLAHEIGHVVLHKGRLDSSMYFAFGGYYSKIEQEANDYADWLLKQI